jgi:LmbE family N-acetylglucosaminyl deacetylase
MIDNGTEASVYGAGHRSPLAPSMLRPRKFGTVTLSHALAAKRIAVVAPHPDDDAIGCGGTLARAAAQGAEVAVIYVTDGSASHPNSERFPADVLRGVREREARAGLRTLGVTAEPAFLRVRDGTAANLRGRARERVVRALAAALESHDCELVLGPWPAEPHPDHAATARLLQSALARCADPPRLWTYAVWLDEFGAPADRPRANVPFVDVILDEGERALKRAAILAHRSQTSDLIDDDPAGFRISAELLERWVRRPERFWRIDPVVAAD